MDARAIDPRDQRWEVDRPAYRVHFVRADGGTEEYELAGGDVLDALAWAHATSGAGRSFLLYARVDGPDGVGLVRLLGEDPNTAPST